MSMSGRGLSEGACVGSMSVLMREEREGSTQR